MPKVLIKIGYQSILLPNDRGCASLLSTLSKAVEVSRDYKSDGECYEVEDPIKVSMTMVTPDVVFKKQNKQLRLNP